MRSSFPSPGSSTITNAAKKWFLVAVSYFFYAFWRADFTLILLTSSVVNFCLALVLGRLADGRARLARAVARHRRSTWASSAAFKYYNFFVATAMNAADSVGWRLELPFFEVGLPIAISFLTFHALSYIIDVYQRKIAPTRSLVDILLYISFFPASHRRADRARQGLPRADRAPVRPQGHPARR